jgi:hypothetical protein
MGIKDLFNINTYTKPVKKAAEQIGLGGVYNALSGAAKGAGENIQYIAPFIPGAAFAGLGSLGTMLSSPLGRAALAGGVGAFAGGRPNLKRGLMSGLTTYGLSSGYQGLQDAGSGAAAGTGTAPFGLTGELGDAAKGVSNLMSSDPITKLASQSALAEEAGRGALTAGYMGVTGMAAIEQQEQYLEELRAQGMISEELYAKKKAQIAASRESAERALRANPYKFDQGGMVPRKIMVGGDNNAPNLYSFARGGSIPRFVSGPGDGMSDSIPANIDGNRPARLTDGEFVIPADVVSHLGNGSSKAGAQQLYAMMDRVRKARTGSKKQGKEINAPRMMPV